ncbi:hypothetical protein Pint_21493 [Pistacia integerrima]|uniref:Uncharacterized protein n=1 Tax=Pistacia integerrima TaxID=434235 RepID=A0ACC0XAF9_9ROSI|nr:hypothetical protein Pint_21493 [Pistacia integerrima]
MAELAAVGSIASVVSAVLEVGKCLAAPIGQFKYLYNYNTNLKNLETDVMKLKKTRDEVQGRVDAAEINGEEIRQSVKEWQTRVDNTINEAERLIEEKEENRRCFKGLRPNCISSYKHSKKAFKLKWDDIGPLLQQEFDEVSFSGIQQCNYETNFVKIRDDVLKLKNARLKVERKVEEATIKGEEIEEDVKKWLEDVDSIIAKAQELIENQSSIGTDRKTRYQNSKAASELMVDHIGPLLQQEERFDEVSYSTTLLSNYETNFDKLRDDVLKLKNARLKVERKVEEAKNNVEEIEEDVKKWLEDVDSIIVKAQELIENQSLIGTDRKTRYQNSKAASELMVTVTLDVKKVQTEIADKLRLTINYESEKASKLCERLKRGKILLILDNIWEDFDLKAMGIPSKMDRGGCKLLLTTRNLDVLQKMDSTNNFGMGILKEEEAWNLFQKMAVLALLQNLCYGLMRINRTLREL